EKAVDAFNIDLNGKTAVDVGASSGGFTDCMLQKGAARVYAVDVGRDQLAEKLREDKRVVNLERTDVRSLTLEEKADFVSIDVAFISLTLVLPAVKSLLRENGELVALIKPQFEAGRGKVGKKGVVRDKAVHREVVERIAAFAQSLGFDVAGMDFSPVKGPEGNIEYLMYAVNRPSDGISPDVWNTIGPLVERSHGNLR
ncbi:MAG: TlyA family RNA methyltransferase, partial [Clostridia bacterium]